MRENKEKTITSGDEDVTVPPLVQTTFVQIGKRKSKSISSAVDLDDLPSHRGPKKQKPGKASLPKVSKVTPLTVNLDDPSVDIEPIQTIHPIQTDPSPLQPRLLTSLIRRSHLIVLLTWCQMRAMHGGRSKESLLTMKSMSVTICQ